MKERLKDQDWVVDKDADGSYSYDAAHLAVLMDIRDELKTLNRLLRCDNFLAIPGLLRQIRAHTTPARSCGR